MTPHSDFYQEIRSILEQARNRVYSTVKKTMVEAYWNIGKRIVEEEQKGCKRVQYGQALIKNLSIALQHDFGKGFSVANLKNFRQFHITFSNDEKSYTLCSQLNWSHLRLIIRMENLNARRYYLQETKLQNWSVRQLKRNLDTRYYERIPSSSDPHLLTEETDQLNYKDFIKDPYIL